MQDKSRKEAARKSVGSFWRAALLAGAALPLGTMAIAQEAPETDEEARLNTVTVTGIRGALQGALDEKRTADSLVEVILAEDIGKLPDQNLAEVLENVTGVQITRTAGVGTGVQIRGTNDNRVEINGVDTVGSGTGRGGTSFEDLAAGIIAGVEVIKAPEAKTIEGSIGGTINLRTIRPLELDADRPLISARIQGEHSDLSSEGGITPRFSGAIGNKWENADGREFGVVLSGSYTQQEASSLRPRVDRDGGLVENINVGTAQGAAQDAVDRPAAQEFDFLGIQFLNQEFENFEFDTLNFAGSVEGQFNNNLKLFGDFVITDQERRQDSTRVQGSGVSSVRDVTVPDSFEFVDFGSLDGVDLGGIQAALTGTIQPNLAVDDDDPNLRFNSDTGARVTDTRLFRLGGEWEKDAFSASAAWSLSTSDSASPTLSTQLNFINPNPLTPLDGGATGDPNTSNDNSVPFIFDLTDGLQFGIDFDSPFAPTVEQLLDPNNVVLDQVDVSRNTTENSDNAFRLDASYDFSDSGFGDFLTSVDVGYRFNSLESTFEDVGDRIGGFSRLEDSPNGSLFAELLVPGPDNASDAGNRDLAIENFIIVDPDRAFNDPEGVLQILQDALAQQRLLEPQADGDLGADLSPDLEASFTIEEQTHAVYGQANFEYGIVRGNVGVRYVDTTVDSVGNSIDEATGAVTEVVTSADYNFWLPRINLIAEPVENVILRGSWTRDIGRPDFGDLNTSVTFEPNENRAVSIGNPRLEPQKVDSFDVSAEWYFAPSAVVSIGYFQKNRTDLFVEASDDALVFDGPGEQGAIIDFRETDPSCPGGGVFNPIAPTNSFGPPDTVGICVDADTVLNDPGTVKQRGIELSAQYDLSEFEDRLGWASGFGFLANYTWQEFSGGEAVNQSASRGTDVFNAINGIYDPDNFVRVSAVQGLLDNSKHAYNITGYYENFGLSARLRYTWRSDFRTLDTAAGASLNSTLGFPVVTADRGQLNGSVTYDLTDQITLGVEGVNLTKQGIEQFCVNEGALLCFEGIADRRITFGASYTF